ncbi:FCSD flavin-binding domain-containing protein [Paracoccus sp. R86501]|uniref:FCSD flavin-binding domain-containing protein n=1 Tax=Paracoccus sp. R86501 TaxID=3101711 RepID=UPI00366A91B0
MTGQTLPVSRRMFLATGAATMLAAPALRAQGTARVVIIGGGAGGASAARMLAAQPGIHVTLVEANPVYTTCFFSNLYLGGLRSFDSLQYGYGGIAGTGVQVIHDRAVAVDRDRRMVILAEGARLSYDRLVLSPGIDFVNGSVPGWSLNDAQTMPHAYRAGPQTQLLARLLRAIPQGGLFAMVAPPNPYRCPPGPYERVSMVAHLFKERNPTAKILILDPKPGFAKQALFLEGWQHHYPGMIERIGPDFGGADVQLRPGSNQIIVDGQVQQVDLCNVIPAQKAGAIADLAGVTDDTGWAPVNGASMASLADPRIFVLGDSADQGDMPKSAYSANSQARVAVDSILSQLMDAPAYVATYANTCWSLIAPGDAVRVGASYGAKDGRIVATDSFISQPSEDAARRRATASQAEAWYDSITAEIFSEAPV